MHMGAGQACVGTGRFLLQVSQQSRTWGWEAGRSFRMDAKRCGCRGAFRIGNRESFWGWPGDDSMIYHELEGRETQGAMSMEERITVQLGVAIEGKWDRK